ncbi:unnamed protein product [Linum tenue]|uniref:Uncharacterized protein n=1 Tax=Linum tenue TaxID=586396 RepID=A0AAV0MGS9_9ROSI|nr:unnamed protein product [Linum tenue]
MGRRDSSPPKQDVPLAWNVRYRRGSRLGLRQGRVQAPRQLRQAEFPQPPHQGSHVEGKFEEYKPTRSDLPELGGERRERREEEETLDGSCKEGGCGEGHDGGDRGEGVSCGDEKRWVRWIIITSIRSNISGV